MNLQEFRQVLIGVNIGIAVIGAIEWLTENYGTSIFIAALSAMHLVYFNQLIKEEDSK